MNSEATIQCAVCGNSSELVMEGYWHCHHCGLWSSDQKPGFGNAIEGMETTAFKNYRIIADHVTSKISISGAKVLDVGSAEGGFTEILQNRGANVLGLEPDKESAEDAILKKLPWSQVSYEDFESDEQYDAVIFNDSFEHMGDPQEVVKKTAGLVKDDGLVVVNAPVSSGLVFAVSRIAAKLGVDSIWRRLWGRGLPSPHVFFYNKKSLGELFSQHGFKMVHSGRMVSMSLDGMYTRVRCTYGPIVSTVISAVACCFVLFSIVFPADVKYFAFKRK